MKKTIVTMLAAASLLPAAALGQNALPSVSRAAPIEDPAAIALPAGPGASRSTESWTSFGKDNPVVRNVTQPTLTPVLPDPAKATGAAVIVAPGGGFFMLSMRSEGYAVARALADRGIAAFVLKYRLDPTPADDKAFLASLGQRFRAPPANASTGRPPAHADATADALAALHLVRSRAAEWHVDPARIGLIGFSAGAMTALAAVQGAPQTERPAFFGYIYGPQTVTTAPAEAPPMFAALALDDPLFATGSFPIVQAWYAAKRPVELHAYQKGGHGFGLGVPGTTTTQLIDEFTAWLSMQGFLGAAKAR